MAEFPVLNFFEKHHSLVSRELLRQRPGDCVLPRASVGQSRLKLLPVKWEEIGDGNINFVYRVWLKLEGSESPDISAVIKHAPTYIRVRNNLILHFTEIKLDTGLFSGP